MLHLKRRGFDLGCIQIPEKTAMPSSSQVQQAWQNDAAIVLPQLLRNDLEKYTENIKESHILMQNVLRTCDFVPFLEQTPYVERIQQNFFIVAASPEEHDEQGIEKVYFDAFDQDEDDVVAEELWCKASWLSFHDEDASLRFRFSWGMEGYEDVSADPLKQAWAGKLCDVLFPESHIITNNATILSHLSSILSKKPSFVERIVYFNAPNGGAQFHHDVERGHAGVVFAQLSGSTFWLALAKPKLMDEIISFVTNAKNQQAIASVLPQENDQQTLKTLCHNREDLSCHMEDPDHELVEALIDRCPEFIAHLVARGHSHILQAGDVLLLPQRDLDNCVWHSVFTLGDTPGEALSFAVR
ncbi:hypothetical protein [Ghiorsea bivora]|uniref:hypothetical protein n=1 Tax=Ghiorsea bivora TaxID=1485545 RepID=UPI00056ECDF1|nr:hypothetical protein [Ghiorsea bivora]